MADAAINLGEARGKVNTSKLFGKVTEVRDYEGKWYTRMSLPAQDEYGSASSVEVRSDTRFASKGDETEALVSVGGYNRSFTRKDGSKASQNSVTLDLVE